MPLHAGNHIRVDFRNVSPALAVYRSDRAVVQAVDRCGTLRVVEQRNLSKHVAFAHHSPAKTDLVLVLYRDLAVTLTEYEQERALLTLPHYGIFRQEQEDLRMVYNQV